MKSGANQSLVREQNVALVVELLRHEAMSNTDLALKLDLSNPALTKILNDLEVKKVIRTTEKEENNEGVRGRKKVYYTINEHGGFIGIINFFNTYINLQLMELNGTLLEEENILNSEFPTFKTLIESRNVFSKILLKYEVNEKQLLAICISSPGKINLKTNRFLKSPKFVNCPDVNLAEFYGDYFKVPTKLENDINLYMKGETEFGSIKGLENAILVHIDTGIGGAILQNGIILTGDDGFAGEFGLMKTITQDKRKVYFDYLCSTNAIKRYVRESMSASNQYLQMKERFKLADVIEQFHDGNDKVRSIVLNTAEDIALLIENLFNAFDCKNIFISGRVRLFGEAYLLQIQNALSVNDQISLRFTKYDEKAISFGAMIIAQESAINVLLNK